MIAGFVSREEAGLRRPRSISRNIDPSRGGVAAHWGGAGSAPSNHSTCIKRWRDWQAFHMDGRGWSDIAYNFGYCNHGFVFAGRGLGVRSGAQGTKYGNDYFYAACWIGGASSTPTLAAYSALLWIIESARQANAGLEVKPHSWFKSTSCPGGDIRSFSREYDGKEVTVQIAGLEWIDHDEWPDWARNAIIKNIEAGVIRGIPAGGNKRRFEADRPLTRAEAAVLMERIGAT